jgi:hypothetical protein
MARTNRTNAAAATETVIGAADAIAINDPSSWTLFVIGGKFGEAKQAQQSVQAGMNTLASLTRDALARDVGEGAKLKTFESQRKLEGWSEESQKYATPGFVAGLRGALAHLADSSFEVYYGQLRKVINDPDGKFTFAETERRARQRGESTGDARLELGKTGGGVFKWTSDADMMDIRAALAVLNATPQPADVAAFAKANPTFYAMLKDIAAGN